jgi:hypothetical protein
MLYFYKKNLIMKKIKPIYLVQLLLLLFVFGIQSCASKKNSIIINKKVVTKKYKSNPSNKNILYLLDGKEVSQTYIENIKPGNIESMNVIKGEKEIAKYTDKKYNGVIIIKLKK